MAVYMEYEGIKGTVTAKGYEDMIKMDFANFGVHRKINMKPGEMSNRESAIPNFSVIHMGKKFESSTPAILKQVFSGSAGKQVKLHYVRTSEKQLNEYLTYTLENCIPTYYQLIALGSGGSGMPVESLYLSYTSMLVSNTPRSVNNKALNPLRYGYDLDKAKSL